jgi:hypothetical protein
MALCDWFDGDPLEPIHKQNAQNNKQAKPKGYFFSLFHTQVKGIKIGTKKLIYVLCENIFRNSLDSHLFVRYLIHQTSTTNQNDYDTSLNQRRNRTFQPFSIRDNLQISKNSSKKQGLPNHNQRRPLQ